VTNYSAIMNVVDSALENVFPAIQLEIWLGGKPFFSAQAGCLDPETHLTPTLANTRFDIASLTKLFTATAFMRLVERDAVSLDQPVASILTEFSGRRPIRAYEDPLNWGKWIEPLLQSGSDVDAGVVTFRNLLAHNSGLPAWRAFKDQPDANFARRLAMETHFFYPTGTRVVYSDVGFILLGFCIERITHQPLDAAISQLVVEPGGLTSTGYLPIVEQPHDSTHIAPTEFCQWRKKRIWGEVHDESCAMLGGISGHAGLFSTANDLSRFGQLFLEAGSPLLGMATVREMVKLQAMDGLLRRGLGFSLWSPDPEMSGNPFSQKAFGHTGFTGTSLWIDPMRQLVAACCTNRVYYGRNPDGILKFRVRLHRAVVEAVDS
jgi:serine-type D-Ala-D-Ala carboxypeptidase